MGWVIGFWLHMGWVKIGRKRMREEEREPAGVAAASGGLGYSTPVVALAAGDSPGEQGREVKEEEKNRKEKERK